MTSMKPISSPIENMRSHYEVLVIGSGYGGGVSASRLARAGRDVCLLERGKEILPPNFPNDLESVMDEAQLDTPVGDFGSKTGLYNLIMNDEMNALVGCGLGGTSLINANVALEIDSKVLAQDYWPARYRSGDLLRPYYKRAAIALGAAISQDARAA